MYPFHPFCLFSESLTYVFSIPARVRLPSPPRPLFSKLNNISPTKTRLISSPEFIFGRGFLCSLCSSDQSQFFSTAKETLVLEYSDNAWYADWDEGNLS